MAIGTTAAILGGTAALAGAGASAYSSYQQSKAAKSAADAQRAYLQQQTAPSRELEQVQLEDYKNITRPILQSEADIYGQYRAPRVGAEEALALDQIAGQRELLGSQRSVGLPAYEALGKRVMSDLNDPFGIPKEVSDRVFQQAQRRIAESTEGTRQRTSERLAGSGALGSGASDALFAEFDLDELQALEDFALEQTLAEINLELSGRQNAIQNAAQFVGLGRSSTPGGTSVGIPQTPTGEVGTTLPYAAEFYTPEVDTGINYAEVLKGGFGGASAAYSLMNPGSSIKF